MQSRRAVQSRERKMRNRLEHEGAYRQQSSSSLLRILKDTLIREARI
jgi:hypothetical protein